MILNPEMIQFFIITILCFPFLIPFFKQKGQIILFSQMIIGLSFLCVIFFQKEVLPIHITFGGWEIINGIEIVFSLETLFFLLATNIVIFAVTIISLTKKRGWHFYFLISLLLTDITCLFVANDLFNIYVTLELLSLLSYLLISIELKKRQIFSSLKYMILGAVGFNLYLISISIIYGEIGTLNSGLLSSEKYQNDFAMMMIMIPLLIKSEVFFFSMWVPSAQTESDHCVSTLLSAVVVNAGLFHLLRITDTLHSPIIKDFLTLVGLSTAFFGALFSAFQKDIKMILAFSTMSHVGFVLIGLSDGGVGYACSHSIYKGLLFLTVGYYINIHQSKNGHKQRKSVPISLYIAFVIGLLSFAGMPFFIGANFKQEILTHSIPNISHFLKFVSYISVFALCRLFLLFKPSKQFVLLPFYDMGILLLASLSMIVGFFNYQNKSGGQNAIEVTLIIILSILLQIFISDKISLGYPYKFFKLTNSLAVFSIIIGIIMSLSAFGIPFF